MDRIIEFKLSVKHDYGSDLVEELRHIDKYFSKYINANVEIIVTELDPNSKDCFTVEVDGKKIEDPTISKVVDFVTKETML